MNKIYICLCILIVYYFYSPVIFAQNMEKISIEYITRPPYIISSKDDSKPIDGVIYKLIIKIFNEAKIPFEFKNVPVIRTFESIKENKKKVCSPSSFKTKEREENAIFSKAIFQDKKTVIIILNRNKEIKKLKKSQEVLSNNNLKLLVKIGFSYGKYLDEKVLFYKKIVLAEKNPQESKNVIFTSSDNNMMLQDIMTGKADYMFIGRNEAEYLLNENPLFKINLEIKDLNDLPEGEKRYIMCSKIVGKETIDKINIEIDKILK